jgi:hypothetical protein
VTAHSQDELKATIKRLFPGADPQETQRATGTSNIDWQNLDSLADLLNAQPVYSPFIKFTLVDPGEPSQAQRDFLSQPGIEVYREIDAQEVLSQVWNVYLERADDDEEARFIGTIEGVSQAQALENAAQFYEVPSHDLMVKRADLDGDPL